MMTKVVKNRRSLTPMLGVPILDGSAPSPTRRNDVRREVSERIQLRRWPSDDKPKDDTILDGWALNVSRGGIRCILEAKVELGDEFELTVGEDTNAPLTRRGRIVWLQEEKDGVIVGMEFMSLSGTHRFTLNGEEASQEPPPVVAGAPPDPGNDQK
jgi:hypothetical protein